MNLRSSRSAKSSAPFAALAAAAFTVCPAFAADITWTPETGDFLDGNNWTGGSVPSGSDDNALISNSGTATMSAGSATMKAIWVGNTATDTATGTLKQTGGAFVLSDGIVVGRQAGATGTYEMTGGTLDLVSFRVGGGNATANGTMTVSGASTVITSTGGSVTGVGLLGTGTLTLKDSAVFNHNSTTPFLVGTDNAVSNGNGGTGTLNVESGAQLNIATGNLAIGRNNLGNGTVNVNGGSIVVAGTNAQINLGVYNGTFNQGAVGTLTINSGSVTGNILRIMEGSGTVNLNGGTLTVGSMFKSGSNLSAAVNFNGGTVRASATSDNFFNGFDSSQLNIQEGGLVFDTNDQVVTFTQGFSGIGAFTKTGGGMLLISGVSTYAGGTFINGGTVVVDGGVLGTGTITVASGGLLDFDYDFTLTTAGLVLETGSEFMLDQNLTFAGLTIAGDTLAEGIYDYTTLKATYGGIFADGGSGQITVVAVPEPAAFALAALGLGAFLVRRRGCSADR